MADLTTIEKQVLEKLFQMGGGYVLNFSDRTMGEFFRDDVGLDIYTKKYEYASGSKANRMRGLWLKADNKTVGKSIIKLIEYIESQILIDNLSQDDFPEDRMKAVKDIAGKEKATDAFNNSNYEIIFGHQPIDQAEKDFFEGVKFLHMSIQFLRNEKAHTPARDLDKNLAIHYISLASLAYDLITRK
ncbi:TIGR02391 family protein [Candidatus Peregrinibacteria bacterium CG11_big_fil_rev_8_21_14_0_20_41_10]|nr:TIGR02391 family protein [Candidatus Magasanikbacteria bacterium]PIQ79971.1 MAG: TIGR02391 family protein [Candidatus Peregrinibacteria bacterium CG11_big_fil_rev_8_21_14_0_20_41_10]